MQIEIWSDIMCPFCYIGKHHFEDALQEVSFREELQITYRSYQLNPEYHYFSGDTVYDLLSRSKGMSVAEAKGMTKQVVDMAAKAGLTINFDTNQPANTRKAHELIHFAAKFGKASLVKEKLFEAHFVLGLQIEDLSVLKQIAKDASLDSELLETALVQGTETYAFNQDIQEAKNIGIRGVPFFLFDRKYALSGAQPTQNFVEVLSNAHSEWKASNQPIQIIPAGNSENTCSDDGCQLN
ncbi:DsbA family oxidoreductase [Sphingobacterium sp. HJSM2_6]|uniref:DsbA family oxidoreductase n=1 Tax=Sphingobacterium sp. HJSM2_6 TaxID=3366264 RepID=UPI003BC7216D